MKKVLLSALVLIGLYSCNNGAYDMAPNVDKSNVPNPLNLPVGPTGDVYMVARINGDTSLWRTSYGTGIQSNGEIKMIGTYGISASKRTIIIDIPHYNGLGIYSMNTNANATYVLNGDTVNSIYGTLNVYEDHNWIRANFSFQGTGVNITEGYVEYQRN